MATTASAAGNSVLACTSFPLELADLPLSAFCPLAPAVVALLVPPLLFCCVTFFCPWDWTGGRGPDSEGSCFLSTSMMTPGQCFSTRAVKHWVSLRNSSTPVLKTCTAMCAEVFLLFKKKERGGDTQRTWVGAGSQKWLGEERVSIYPTFFSGKAPYGRGSKLVLFCIRFS